jgi:hypothetical protein
MKKPTKLNITGACPVVLYYMDNLIRHGLNIIKVIHFPTFILSKYSFEAASSLVSFTVRIGSLQATVSRFGVPKGELDVNSKYN